MISPLSLTSSSFVQEVTTLLGRGQAQAKALYRSWWREGRWSTEDPCFNNCPVLSQHLQEMKKPYLPEEVRRLEEHGHTKAVLRLHDGLEVETVALQMTAGTTLCISSQVGCAMGCAFCETGRMGLLRNLAAEEITAQVWWMQHRLQKAPRNLVFMGMGEPFDNFDAVHQALRVLMDPIGLGLGPRHITISTVGRVDGIERMRQEMDPSIHLAVSLNAPHPEIRRRIMPVEQTYDMQSLREALERYTEGGRTVLLEYVLLEEVNDAVHHADALIQWIGSLPVKVNCIPYNPQTRARFQTPNPERIEAFMRRLREEGVHAILRHHKGRSSMAACGQLGNVRLRHQLRARPLSSVRHEEVILCET